MSICVLNGITVSELFSVVEIFMTEQAKILRVFRLIRLLQQRPYRTIPELAQTLEITPRSVYRYISLLDSLGYCIDSDPVSNRYFLFEQTHSRSISLSVEESALLGRIIEQIPEQSPLKASLRQKLYLRSDLLPLAQDTAELQMSNIVERLHSAIEQRKRVILKSYHSTTENQQGLSDRIVEPLYWHDNFAAIQAIEVSSGVSKTFKTKRMHDVVCLAEPQQHQPVEQQTDAFGFSERSPILIKLKLTHRAYRLMFEEFPAARPYLQQTDQAEAPYRFVGEVRSLIGIGRFILGLPSEIQVESPNSLKTYLKEEIAKARW